MKYFVLLQVLWPNEKKNKSTKRKFVIKVNFTCRCRQKERQEDGNPALQSHATNPVLFFSPPDQQLQ